jgi:RNA polymerase sigma-70 factor (ECF subfamily)
MLDFLSKKYAVCSDEELMAYVIKGNHKAFEEVYKRYAPGMLRFFYRHLYQDKDKAQDFLQDLFLKLIEKAEGYHPDKKFKIWLYTIAHNMCKNEYRRNEVRGMKVNDFDFGLITNDDMVLNFKDKFDRSLFNRMLAEELNGMDAVQSLTFALRYQEHLSVKEIAEIMECAEGTVKSRLFYTLKKLTIKLDIFNPYKEV